jgi:hypothetical protein
MGGEVHKRWHVSDHLLFKQWVPLGGTGDNPPGRIGCVPRQLAA